MKLYRVAVMTESMPGSRWHDGLVFAAVGTNAEDAARNGMAAYVASRKLGEPAPLGATAVEIEEAAIVLGERISAVDRAEMGKLTKRPDWSAYVSPSAAA